jgi:hypothetical protein
VDDRSQSTPAGPFHWSRTTDASVSRWRVNDAFDYFDGSHAGYEPVVHRRHVLALHEDLLVVADLIDGEGPHAAAVHWHVHPRWTARIVDRSVLFSGARRPKLFATRGRIDLLHADSESGLGWYSPAYGRVDPATTVRVAHQGDAPFWIITVFDWSAGEEVQSVETVPVWAEASALVRSAGVRIARTSSTDYLLIVEPHPNRAHATWRIAEFETDARMLFLRTSGERQVSRIALVDGSMVCSGGRHRLQLLLPHAVPDLHLDLGADVRIAGPIADAQLVVNGRERVVEPRTQNPNPEPGTPNPKP